MVIDGDGMRKLRQVYRLSCDELGALMNVTGRFISLVEHGDRKLPVARADMLITELDLTPEKFRQVLSFYDETEVVYAGRNAR